MDFYSVLFQNCGDAVVVADHRHQITFANSKAKQLFAEDYDVLMTETAFSKSHLFEMERKTETQLATYPLRNVLAGDQFCDREFLLQSSRSSTDIWLSITGFPVETDACLRGVLIIRDITEQKVALLQNLRRELHDEFGGVTRAAFMTRLEKAIQQSQRDPSHLTAILCIDIVRLRSVNNSLGYAAGDQLLGEFASRLINFAKSEDNVSRLRGDEFTILLEGINNQSEVLKAAKRIQAEISEPFCILNTEIQVEASIGIAFANDDCQTSEVLLRRASIAMYEAKKSLRERHCIFENSMQTDNHGTLQWEMSLRKAVANHEFFLEYQPIFQIKTRQIIGLESLVRWNHPTQGRVSPGQFIPLAERTGLIVPLGWWVLEESCRQMKTWQDEIPNTESFFVSVNMSSRQFSQEDVVQKIQDVLNQVGLSAKSLKIEITEGVLIEHSSSIIQKLEAIRDMGITLSIDDFGTGYSSLSYLHRFPVDTLKIDRSFIENADADYEKLEILQSVVRLAWNLGLEVVAEGIETEKHYARIRALRCESGQGFLFSKPLAANAMGALMQQQSMARQ